MTPDSSSPPVAAATAATGGALHLLREFVHYFGASVIALTLDMTLLLVLASFIHYLIAATIGFAAGALLAYLLSTRVVFARRKLAQSPRRELAIFVGVGLVGLALNNAVIFAGVEWLAAPLSAVKIAAAGATFMSNFALRKLLLF